MKEQLEEGEGRGVMRVAGCQEGGTPHMPGGTYLAGILQIMLRERLAWPPEPLS